jgi:hypothetical protein
MFDHLKETGLSYFAHMQQALSYCARLQMCVIKVFIHSFLPDMYTNDASNEICKLHKEMHGE